MSYAQDLLESARKPLREHEGQPVKASDCNRAVSTAYYALFDCLCTKAADQVAGKLLAHQVPGGAWIRVYRSLDHEHGRDALILATQAATIEANPFALVDTIHNKLLEAREVADYDRGRDYDVEAVLVKVSEAQFAVDYLEEAGTNSDIDTELISQIIVEILVPEPKR